MRSASIPSESEPSVSGLFHAQLPLHAAGSQDRLTAFFAAGQGSDLNLSPPSVSIFDPDRPKRNQNLPPPILVLPVPTNRLSDKPPCPAAPPATCPSVLCHRALLPSPPTQDLFPALHPLRSRIDSSNRSLAFRRASSVQALSTTTTRSCPLPLAAGYPQQAGHRRHGSRAVDRFLCGAQRREVSTGRKRSTIIGSVGLQHLGCLVASFRFFGSATFLERACQVI
jgi:hypothetical protein